MGVSSISDFPPVAGQVGFRIADYTLFTFNFLLFTYDER